VMTACEVNPVVAGQFMRVTSMVDSPIRLLGPSILVRVMRPKRRRPTDVQSVDEGFAKTLVAGCNEVIPQTGVMPAEVAAQPGAAKCE
jgi:hypothetical protein